ncbi:MAG: DNA cytosine methyltransferase [archaeon]
MSNNVLDLFCGAGGLSEGFKQSGYNIIAGVDNTEKFLKTFKENHKNSKSIKANLFEKSPKELLEENNIDKNNIDIIIGGPPCKGFSFAGERDPNDKRNNLVDRFIDFVDFIKPNAVVMENVPGILSMKNGKVVDTIINRLNKNYNTKYKTLNSAEYGVPQIRKRVIFIGFKNKNPNNYHPKITHSEERIDLPNYITVGDALLSRKIINNIENLSNQEKINHSDDMIKRMGEVKSGDSLYDSYTESYKRLTINKPSHTIKNSHMAPFIHPIKNRVGTVRECAILQSFPNNFKFCSSRSSQYEQVGNAVPPLLAKKIADKIRKIL